MIKPRIRPKLGVRIWHEGREPPHNCAPACPPCDGRCFTIRDRAEQMVERANRMALFAATGRWVVPYDDAEPSRPLITNLAEALADDAAHGVTCYMPPRICGRPDVHVCASYGCNMRGGKCSEQETKAANKVLAKRRVEFDAWEQRRRLELIAKARA